MKLFINITSLFLLIAIVFNSWFNFSSLSSGDWSYKYAEMIRDFTLYPYVWDMEFFNGLGGNKAFLLALNTFYLSTISILFNVFKVPWILIERLVWFWPFLIVTVFSSYYLFKKLFFSKYALLSSFVFLFNTYILMIVGGGQMGIAMAYSIAPFVLLIFIKLKDNFDNFNKNFTLSIAAGLLFSLQIVFDLRVAYITLFAVFILWILKNIENKNTNYFVKSILFVFITPAVASFLLNAFWLLPTIISGRNPIEDLGSAYSSLEAVKFFSFAKLEDSISLLHPNWPENIFGKTGFLKSEFLALPILAFSALLIKNIAKEKRLYVLFFALLGLLGIFLAKGANEPLGGIYLWLFDNFPGFIMFRDPTKWYTLIALSYSMLIPFTVWKIYEWIKSQPKFQISNFKFQIKSKNQILNFQNLFLLFIVFCLLCLIRPALLGQLSGTFKSTQVPQDYIKLEKFLSSQKTFSRTLWIPTLQRFGYYSNSHPAIPAQNLFKTVENSEIIKKMNTKETELFLQEASVKYVVVPYDSQGEIFLKDRKYNKDIYQKTINDVKQISYLKQISSFGKIKVFEASNPKDHFWTDSKTLKLNYKYISPVEYRLEVKNAKIGDKIVFSENYDASWIARDSQAKFYHWDNLISSNPYGRAFNSFSLRKAGNYSLIVYYYPQIAVNIGVVISFSTLILVLAFIIFGSKLKKW